MVLVLFTSFSEIKDVAVSWSFFLYLHYQMPFLAPLRIQPWTAQAAKYKLICFNQTDPVFCQGYRDVTAFSGLAKQTHGIQSHWFI